MIKQTHLLLTGFLLSSFMPIAQSADWIEGTWSFRAVSITSEDGSVELLEAVDAITIALVSGNMYAVTLPSDDGPETVNFTLAEQEGFYQGVRQGNFDGQSYDYEYLRAYRLDDDTGILMLLGLGGEGTNLQPIYYMDVAVAVVGRNGLPPAASLDNRSGTYRGFGSGVDVDNGVFTYNESTGEVTLSPAGGGYLLDPQDGDGPETVLRQSGYLLYDDFDTSREGPVEMLAILPVNNTDMCFVRFEGFSQIFDPFQNFFGGGVEAGIVSTDPGFVIPSFIGPEPPSIGPVTPVAGDWVSSSWLGYLYDSNFPWIYGPRLNWVRLLSGDPDGLVLYDQQSGAYFWTSQTVFPFVYNYGTGQWIPLP